MIKMNALLFDMMFDGKKVELNEKTAYNDNWSGALKLFVMALHELKYRREEF